MGLTIGSILPRSDMYPALSLNFLNGIKLAFKNKKGSVNPVFVSENIGNAADDLVLSITEKMILQQEIDITISCCNFSNSKPIKSPRRKLFYNTYNEFQVSNFKLLKLNYNKNRYHNTILNNVKAFFSDDFYQKFEDAPFSGWKNPYICT